MLGSRLGHVILIFISYTCTSINVCICLETLSSLISSLSYNNECIMADHMIYLSMFALSPILWC